jgi:HAD superfamily hydrolase (TIGR01490 family)
MNIALFDLDNTLINGDSDYEWGNFLVENNYVDKEYYQKKNDVFFEQYRKGTLCPIEFAKFSYEPLAKYDYEFLLDIRKKFFKEKIKPIIHKKAEDLVKLHKKNNDIIVIVTATNSFISRLSADYFKIEDLLATEPEFKNGKFTGGLYGEPCFKEGKVNKVKKWMESNKYTNYEDIYFYTDSHNDMNLLEFCTIHVAVDPDNILKEISIKNNWKIISLK